MAIISFHSLEDRMVKRFFASRPTSSSRTAACRSAVDLPQPELKLLSKMKPSDREVDENPRARSAVMRVARRLPVPEGA
jgi:16S rRNA (cytosine1402-N4)-methyltransferase